MIRPPPPSTLFPYTTLFRSLPILAALTLGAAACAKTGRGEASGDQVPASALAAIVTATLMRHIRVLSADSLLGRLPGTAGEEQTVVYIEGQVQAVGDTTDQS